MGNLAKWCLAHVLHWAVLYGAFVMQLDGAMYVLKLVKGAVGPGTLPFTSLVSAAVIGMPMLTAVLSVVEPTGVILKYRRIEKLFPAAATPPVPDGNETFTPVPPPYEARVVMLTLNAVEFRLPMLFPFFLIINTNVSSECFAVLASFQ